MERYCAIAATGIVLNVHTGEVVAMASLPDYDPNDPVDALKPDRLNRITAGVYEVGSIFKSFTFAMALDSGAVTIERPASTRPARIRVGRFTINDFHGKHRVLTVPEVFIFSSNIGTARMALKVGADGPAGISQALRLLRPDRRPTCRRSAAPIVPKKWSELTAMTVAFGHGLAVSPLQVAVADAALVNGGKLIPPTFLPRTREEADKLAVQVISAGDQRLDALSLPDERREGHRARAPRCPATSSAARPAPPRRSRAAAMSGNKRLNSFLAAFPMDDPQYVVLVVLDEPKPEKEGAGATAGLNAAPTVAAVIRRSAALLGVKPRTIDPNGVVLVSN